MRDILSVLLLFVIFLLFSVVTQPERAGRWAGRLVAAYEAANPPAPAPQVRP